MTQVVPSRLSEAVAEEIRVLLARRRMSAAKLAERIGWKQQYIARRMVGAQSFDLDDLEAIAEGLGVQIIDLFPDRARATRDYLGPDARPVVPRPAPIPAISRRPPRRTDASRPRGAPPATRGRTAPTGNW